MDSDLVEVPLRFDRSTSEFIRRIAACSGTTTDQAASVIAVLAMERWLRAEATPLNPEPNTNRDDEHAP